MLGALQLVCEKPKPGRRPEGERNIRKLGQSVCVVVSLVQPVITADMQQGKLHHRRHDDHDATRRTRSVAKGHGLESRRPISVALSEVSGQRSRTLCPSAMWQFPTITPRTKKPKMLGPPLQQPRRRGDDGRRWCPRAPPSRSLGLWLARLGWWNRCAIDNGVDRRLMPLR